MKLKLPADLSIDTEVDLGTTGGGYLLQARLNVNLPGIEREVWWTVRTRSVHILKPHAATSTL
jgi:hypothetical protein